jgi:imidazolonepropionase-like amidohydrolase
MTTYHLRAVPLPDTEPIDLWVRDGVVRTESVPGARTLVRSGYVLPGLVDAHCHIAIDQTGPTDLDRAAEQALIDRDAGTLLIRDCGSPIDVSPLQRREDLPRLIRAGRHIARPKRYLRYIGVELSDPRALPDVVAEQAAEGNGWVKIVGDWIDRTEGDLAPLWPEDVLAEAIRVAHRAGARVTAHVFGENALPGLINAGIDCIEHGTGLTDEIIERMAARRTALVPTLINIENFPSFAEQAAEKFPGYAAHMIRLHENCRQTVGKAIEAGVPVYAGTDAGGGIRHGRLVDEIVALREAGMSPTQALGAASWAAREWLGWSGLTDGAPADLVVYPNDPREDLDALRAPSLIMLRGRVVSEN